MLVRFSNQKDIRLHMDSSPVMVHKNTKPTVNFDLAAPAWRADLVAVEP